MAATTKEQSAPVSTNTTDANNTVKNHADSEQQSAAEAATANIDVDGEAFDENSSDDDKVCDYDNEEENFSEDENSSDDSKEESLNENGAFSRNGSIQGSTPAQQVVIDTPVTKYLNTRRSLSPSDNMSVFNSNRDTQSCAGDLSSPESGKNSWSGSRSRSSSDPSPPRRISAIYRARCPSKMERDPMIEVLGATYATPESLYRVCFV